VWDSPMSRSADPVFAPAALCQTIGCSPVT
jgi:hypothetical protein